MLGPAASEEEIKAMLDKHGQLFVKPVFKGGIGKKGKAGLLGRASDLKTALAVSPGLRSQSDKQDRCAQLAREVKRRVTSRYSAGHCGAGVRPAQAHS